MGEETSGWIYRNMLNIVFYINEMSSLEKPSTQGGEEDISSLSS